MASLAGAEPSRIFVVGRGLDQWEDGNSALAYRGPDGFTQDTRDLLQLMEEAACVRNANRYAPANMLASHNRHD
jgi:hypothetical protein